MPPPSQNQDFLNNKYKKIYNILMTGVLWRMPSSGMSCYVALVRTHVLVECITSETSVTTATWHDNPEDGILHSHRRENFKSHKCFVNYSCFVNLWPPLWSSGQSSWRLLLRFRVRFPALPDFLTSSGSGTGSTQPLWG
jgi:hypothetical protein